MQYTYDFIKKINSCN